MLVEEHVPVILAGQLALNLLIAHFVGSLFAGHQAAAQLFLIGHECVVDFNYSNFRYRILFYFN